jgi:hypothetical protein
MRGSYYGDVLVEMDEDLLVTATSDPNMSET